MTDEELRALFEIPENVWIERAFDADPMGHRLTGAQRLQIAHDASACGRETAQMLELRNHCVSVTELLQTMGVGLVRQQQESCDAYMPFACFQPPCTVVLYDKTINVVKTQLSEHHAAYFPNEVCVEDILLAHELFHILEARDKTIYTEAFRFTSVYFGFLKLTSKLIASSEIAAMSFARELLKLPFSPFVLNGLL